MRKPPIQYLIAFAAAAKLNSFKLAARSLHVSPSAISQQIKTLEQHLGLSLFHRQQRELQLTQAGKRFYQIANSTLSQYETGFAQFKNEHYATTLKVSTIPFIANELLIPNLHNFQERYPNINLVIETSMKIEDLEWSNLDAAIRFGIPPWQNYQAALIAKAQSTLVASQAYFRQNPIETHADWQQQTLIHIRKDTNDWQRFMAQTGIKFTPKKELYFDSYTAAIRAAEEGLGVAIGIYPIIQTKLLSGTLCSLSPKFAPLEESFYLVTQANQNKHLNHAALLQWLKQVFTHA